MQTCNNMAYMKYEQYVHMYILLIVQCKSCRGGRVIPKSNDLLNSVAKSGMREDGISLVAKILVNRGSPREKTGSPQYVF